MTNPLESIRSELEKMRAELRRQIHIDLLQEGVLTGLSRLATLDAEHAEAYQTAIKDMG